MKHVNCVLCVFLVRRWWSNKSISKNQELRGPCLPDGSDSRTRVCFDGPARAQQGGADGSSRSEEQINRCLKLKTHVQQFFMNVHKSDTEVCALQRDIRSGKLQGTVLPN